MNTGSMLRVFRILVALAVTATSTALAAMPPWIGQVRRALHDELRRSMDSLAIESLKKPYYMEYTFRYRWSARVKVSLGGTLDSGQTASARLTVGIRVGSPERDNTNFFDAALLFFGGDDDEAYRNRAVPLEPTYATMRYQAWLATDAAFKSALEQYAKKEAVLKNRIQQDTTPDFVLLPPQELADTAANIPFVDLITVCKQLRGISALSRDFPEIQTATITFEHLPELILYINSEGRQMIKLHRQVGIEIVATTQAPDGMPLAQTYTAYARTLDELPSWDSLARAMRSVLEHLRQMAAAPVVTEPYSGPVLFVGQAAAELFAQVFAPNLVAQRQQLAEQGVQEQNRFGALQNRIGARVMAEFLSVESAPQRTTIGKTPAAGAYRIDDEGIEPEPLVLVRRGYLETLLSSRVPTRRIRLSNGRSRGGAAMYDVLVLRTEHPARSLSERALLRQMQRILERRDLPYGYIVREVLDQNLLYTAVNQQTSGAFPIGGEGQIPVLQIERIWRDGRRQLVRGALLVPGGYQVFRDVVAVGKSLYVHNLLAPSVVSPYRSGGAQYVVATVASPDVLIEDLELRPLEGGYPKPPLLPSPLWHALDGYGRSERAR